MAPLATLLFAASLVAQVPPPPPPPMQGVPPRDVVQRPEPKGTAVIRGRVVAADTGTPIRRANVNLLPTAPLPPAGGSTTTQTATVMVDGVPRTITSSTSMGMGMQRSRSATTDSQGNFEFAELPAGTYRVVANTGQYSAAYLGSAYGAKRVNTPFSSDLGAPIQLAEGQRFDKATIALPRGAVITGRVTDENGEAMARVSVYTMYATGSVRPMRTGSNAQTDDLGQYRLFGLQPGDYLVVAEARGPTFVAPNAPPETEEDKIGFMTTYFPGTADEATAQRVQARAGRETSGVEIRLVSGRLFRISGTITDSQGRPSARTNGSLFRNQIGIFSNFGFNTDEQGRFQMRNIPPGNYRLIIRGRMEPGQNAQTDPPEMAAMPLAINGDVEGLVITTGPGVSITGQVIFDQAPPLSPSGQPPTIRINAMVADPQGNIGMPSPQPVTVTPELTFTMKGMLGEYLLRANGPNMVLKSVMVGTEDVTDRPREFKNGDRVTIVLTTRSSTIEGTVTDVKGEPTADAGILVFSDDKSSWLPNSVRTRRSGPNPAGQFRVTGLLPGRYYIVALPRERLNMPFGGMDAAFFEQMTKEATPFVVGEDETRQIDLKVAMSSGG